MASSSSERKLEREKEFYRAKLADEAKRHDDMFDAIKRVAKMDGELTPDVRRLLSLAFKNVIGSRRATWRLLSLTEKKDDKAKDDFRTDLVNDYKLIVSKEISSICDEVLAIIDNFISSETTPESYVFSYKMIGDCNRYLAELNNGDVRVEFVNKSLKAYEMATDIAEKELTRIDPLLLSLALNYSIMCYENKTADRAITIAQNAFDKAMDDMLAENKQSSNKEANQHILLKNKGVLLTMELLKYNLTLWKDESLQALTDN